VKAKIARFLKSKDGNLALLALFLAAIIIFASLAIYTGNMVYTNYYSAQIAMERSIDGAMEEYLQSYEVKDIVVRVDPNAVKDLTAENMLVNGLLPRDDGYVLQKGGNVAYTIAAVAYSGTEDYVTISGTFKMRMPWAIAQGIVIEIPVKATSRLTYISRS